MHYTIEQRRADIALVCRRYSVRQLEVFGSAARSAQFDPATIDADFLVDFQSGGDLAPLEQFFGLADALARRLGSPVDLVEARRSQKPIRPRWHQPGARDRSCSVMRAPVFGRVWAGGT